MQSLWRQMERYSPAVLTTLTVLLAAVPLHITGLGQVMPIFALISIYFWETFVPGSLPLIFLFALGLLEDTLSGLPLALSSIINIVFALLLLREHRNFRKAHFVPVWFGFILLSLAVLALQWVIMSIYLGALLPVTGCVLQWLATCLAYPPMHLLFTRVYRNLMG